MAKSCVCDTEHRVTKARREKCIWRVPAAVSHGHFARRRGLKEPLQGGLVDFTLLLFAVKQTPGSSPLSCIYGPRYGWVTWMDGCCELRGCLEQGFGVPVRGRCTPILWDKPWCGGALSTLKIAINFIRAGEIEISSLESKSISPVKRWIFLVACGSCLCCSPILRAALWPEASPPNFFN